MKETAQTLTEKLLDTINRVMDGTIKAEASNTIATQAREVVRLAKLRADVCAQMGEKVPDDLATFVRSSEPAAAAVALVEVSRAKRK